MPTPFGHALAGLSVLWYASAIQPRRPQPVGPPGVDPSGAPSPGHHWRSLGIAVACVCLSAAPDLDLLGASHRTVTHSVTAAVLVGVVAACGMGAFRRPALRAGILVGLIWASHGLLDWLGRDSSPPFGIMWLWPFSQAWFISNLDLFSEVSRRYWLPQSFWLHNVAAVAREAVLLGPLASVAWWWAHRTTRTTR